MSDFGGSNSLNSISVHSANLTSGQIIFKEGLIWLVWRNSFCKELFRSDIAYTLFSVQKNIKFWKLEMLISQFFNRRSYQATYLKNSAINCAKKLVEFSALIFAFFERNAKKWEIFGEGGRAKLGSPPTHHISLHDSKCLSTLWC